ncbi:hypothetical protein CICLE_v10030010mg [Citrus x clementina]|uniref:Nefa Nip30 N domain-containing protein n=3 Tax=Citrus TaxID=2706 RepID=A0ACB8IQT6_CITSI|nr:hypothetical protein CICLE_v10030010mg [Citrus x clementina]KAH9699589.1 Nefa Nip30 N domain-containing protein [Citrus sinensis]
MADEQSTATSTNALRINFVSEEQLDEAKKTRGERVEEGQHRERPLHEILNENKAKKKKDLEDRRKHKPPKSLDEDEAQFLDGWESYKKEKERRLADQEALELRRFRAAVASQCVASKETLISHDDDHHQQRVIIGKKNPASRPLSSIMKVMPLAKKPKKDVQIVAAESSSDTMKKIDAAEKSPEPAVLKRNRGDADHNKCPVTISLVSYGSDSEDNH